MKRYYLIFIPISIMLSAFYMYKNEGDLMLTLQSSSFKTDEAIPTKYTCKGENVSPHLQWQGAPANTAGTYEI